MRAALATAALLALVLVACGGDDDPGSNEQAAACGAIEEVRVDPFGDHHARDFRASDYETNPPAGGDHSSEVLEPGHYSEPAPLGEAVHLLEHGAVIGWTNGLSAEDAAALEAAFADLEQAGYFQLATVENPSLEVPFALSAWGALQTCERVDASAIAAFVERWYASPKAGEGALACEGRAAKLTPCRTEEAETRPA